MKEETKIFWTTMGLLVLSGVILVGGAWLTTDPEAEASHRRLTPAELATVREMIGERELTPTPAPTSTLTPSPVILSDYQQYQIDNPACRYHNPKEYDQ